MGAGGLGFRGLDVTKKTFQTFSNFLTFKIQQDNGNSRGHEALTWPCPLC